MQFAIVCSDPDFCCLFVGNTNSIDLIVTNSVYRVRTFVCRIVMNRSVLLLRAHVCAYVNRSDNAEQYDRLLTNSHAAPLVAPGFCLDTKGLRADFRSNSFVRLARCY